MLMRGDGANGAGIFIRNAFSAAAVNSSGQLACLALDLNDASDQSE